MELHDLSSLQAHLNLTNLLLDKTLVCDFDVAASAMGVFESEHSTPMEPVIECCHAFFNMPGKVTLDLKRDLFDS